MKFVVAREFTRSGKIFVSRNVCVYVWIKFYCGS